MTDNDDWDDKALSMIISYYFVTGTDDDTGKSVIGLQCPFCVGDSAWICQVDTLLAANSQAILHHEQVHHEPS